MTVVCEAVGFVGGFGGRGQHASMLVYHWLGSCLKPCFLIGAFRTEKPDQANPTAVINCFQEAQSILLLLPINRAFSSAKADAEKGRNVLPSAISFSAGQPGNSLPPFIDGQWLFTSRPNGRDM